MLKRREFLNFFGTSAAVPVVKSIERLDLQPNDTLVVTVEAHPSQEILSYLKEEFEKRFPGRKILIVSSEISLKVLRAE